MTQLLVFGVLGTTLGSFVMTFVAFVIWISSLKEEIRVHAPLLDNARRTKALDTSDLAAIFESKKMTRENLRTKTRMILERPEATPTQM